MGFPSANRASVQLQSPRKGSTSFTTPQRASVGLPPPSRASFHSQSPVNQQSVERQTISRTSVTRNSSRSHVRHTIARKTRLITQLQTSEPNERVVQQALATQPLESFAWYRLGLSRDAALQTLASGSNGAFVIRDSSQQGAYVPLISLGDDIAN